MPSHLAAIWLKQARRRPMLPVNSARLISNRGLDGNANQGGRRQVTLLDAEAWESMMRELGADLPPSIRRANLLLSGLSLKKSRGRTLLIGSCQIRIQGETRPCERMDEALQGLQAAMRADWRGGAFGIVEVGREIREGDEIRWADTP